MKSSKPTGKTTVPPSTAQKNRALVRQLLTWYDGNHRKLPWRAAPRKPQDPYRVWLSEIMLQQTTVPAVVPYYLKFMKRWPKIEALAAAPVEDVMSAWAGLGYYSRARNLHACARLVAEKYDGLMPSSEQELQSLPGIGPYTAAAIAAIAFGRQAAPVDGNIERVLTRLRCVHEPLPASKPHLKQLALELAPARRAGDFAQALMDLGSEICTPRSPTCLTCPWMGDCAAFKAGIADELPRRAAKKARPVRRAATFVMFSPAGRVFLRRRSDKGLLAGMHETPTTPFAATFPKQAGSLAPVSAEFKRVTSLVTHTFTHFELELQVFVAQLSARQVPSLEGEWAELSALDDFALPSLFRKVIRASEPAPSLTRKRLRPARPLPQGER